MTVSMYKISVPIFVQHLTALSGVLDKAVAHIEAKSSIRPSSSTCGFIPTCTR